MPLRELKRWLSHLLKARVTGKAIQLVTWLNGIMKDPRTVSVVVDGQLNHGVMDADLICSTKGLRKQQNSVF